VGAGGGWGRMHAVAHGILCSRQGLPINAYPFSKWVTLALVAAIAAVLRCMCPPHARRMTESGPHPQSGQVPELTQHMVSSG
jgi:hypothetical protein